MNKSKDVLNLICEDEIKVGDKVRYSTKFLRNTGQYTGDIPFARGIVTALEPLGKGSIRTFLAVIDWGNPDIPERVLVSNLEKTDKKVFVD